MSGFHDFEDEDAEHEKNWNPFATGGAPAPAPRATSGYDADDILQAFADADAYGYVMAVCHECGHDHELEADGYCDCEECGAPVRSPLLEAGMI